jgi:hypothetical protein
MTEAQWLCEINPLMLIPHLRKVKGIHRTRAGRRKLRLFGCNCCRRVWHLFESEEQCAKLVELAERLAEGAVGAEAVEPFLRTGLLRGEHGLGPCRNAAARYVASSDIGQASERAAMRAADLAAYALSPPSVDEHVRLVMEEREQQVLLVYEMFGNPFRPVTFSPSWRTDTTLALARQMYDSRDFGAMPILADALQDAGCDNADLLDHCRGPGPHVRGCWVVDLVLGKE